MKRKRIAYMVAFASAALVVAGVAYAALPYSGTDGNTVEGCYSPGGNVKVLTAAEPTCPKGYTPIKWNVTGPQGMQGMQGIQGEQGPQGPEGPQGPAGTSATNPAYTNYGTGLRSIGEGLVGQVASLTLPAGSYTLMANAHVSRVDDTRFAQCTLIPGNVNSTVALFPLAAVGGIRLPIMGDVTAPSGTTVYVQCWGLDGPIQAAGAVIATRVSSITASE